MDHILTPTPLIIKREKISRSTVFPTCPCLLCESWDFFTASHPLRGSEELGGETYLKKKKTLFQADLNFMADLLE